MTLTKEWLLKTIAGLEEERDATPGAVNEDAAMALAAMKLALASLEAEAVAWRYRFVHTPKSEEHGSPFTTDWVLAHSEEECNPSDCFERQPLYIAPPAPVAMKDHQIRALVNELRDIAVEYYGTQQLRERIAKTVRAAMLQGTEPVSNRDELPECLVKAMQAAIEQLDRRAGYIGHGYPQHCHTVRGFWDQGNGSIAHEPCSVCALWDEMRDYLSAAPQQEVK